MDVGVNHPTQRAERKKSSNHARVSIKDGAVSLDSKCSLREKLITFQIHAGASITTLHVKHYTLHEAQSESRRAGVKLHRRGEAGLYIVWKIIFCSIHPSLLYSSPLISCTITLLDEGLTVGVMRRMNYD